MKIQKAFTGPKKPSLVRTVLINILFIIGPSRLIHDMQCKVSFSYLWEHVKKPLNVLLRERPFFLTGGGSVGKF